MFIPPQCGVELRLWGGKTPHTKTGGVEFSTPKLHPTVGWSLVQIWGRWGGVGWSAFFRFSVNSTPQWGGVWGGVEGYDWREAPKIFSFCDLKSKLLRTDGREAPEILGVFYLRNSILGAFFYELHPTLGWTGGATRRRRTGKLQAPSAENFQFVQIVK